VDHLGIQTDSAEELAELNARAQAADMVLLDDGEATCCYSRSEKHWITDPAGIAWEHFHTVDSIPVFGESRTPDAESSAYCATTKPSGKPIGIPVKPATSCC
jgi:lactoylglutathione lyase